MALSCYSHLFPVLVLRLYSLKIKSCTNKESSSVEVEALLKCMIYLLKIDHNIYYMIFRKKNRV